MDRFKPRVTKIAGLASLAFILRLDAVICPFGTGLIYSTTTSRISLAMGRNGYVPDQFEQTSKRTDVPVFGILFSTAIGLLFLLPFPSWSKLVGIDELLGAYVRRRSAGAGRAAQDQARPALRTGCRPREYSRRCRFVCASWSLIIYKLAVARRLPEEDVDRYIADVYPPPVE